MDEGVLEAARAVRPYLAEFMDSAVAAEVDAELAGLLATAAGGEDVEGRLRAVLEADEATGVFLERVLEDAPDFRPPQVVSELTSRYSGLPGIRRPSWRTSSVARMATMCGTGRRSACRLGTVRRITARSSRSNRAR